MNEDHKFLSMHTGQNFRRFLLYHLPALAYAVLIYYVSSLQHVSPPSFGLAWADKVYHFGEFFLLSIFIHIALKYHSGSFISRHIYLMAAAIAIIFAVTDEVHQYFVPGRESTPGDFLADSLGAISAQVILWIYGCLRPKKEID